MRCSILFDVFGSATGGLTTDEGQVLGGIALYAIGNNEVCAILRNARAKALIFCHSVVLSARSIGPYVLRAAGKKPGGYLFTGRRGPRQAMATRQYARLLADWVASIGLDPKVFGTHSLRRTKATLIYRRTGNLRAVQLLLGHAKLDTTALYTRVATKTISEVMSPLEHIALKLQEVRPPG
jgi:integrase